MSDSDSEISDQFDGLHQADEEWEEWAGDGEDDGDDDATVSLFSPTVLPSPEAAFEHDATQHGFDLRQYRVQRSLGDYDVIKVINFIRSEVAAGRDPRPLLAAAPAAAAGSSDAAAAAVPWASDTYLQPVLPDDPLLTYDYEEGAKGQDLSAAMAAMAGPSSSAAAVVTSSSSCSSDPAAVIAALRAQLAAVQGDNQQLLLRVAALMEVALPADVQAELREAAAADRGQAAAGSSGAGSSGLGASSSSSTVCAGPAAAAGPGPSGMQCVAVSGPGHHLARRVDAAYFDSYSYFDIHHEMLSDKPRTQAYQSALTRNPSLLSGSTVLDVGCGTGILSLFAAQGGAAAVVGLDGSERIAGFARQIVAANKLDAGSGGPINIISGKVEEVNDIGHEKVSVLVSEWMGYALLFESMLDSLLAARDKWLAPGGAVLPDKATIWVAGADATAFGTAFWEEVYGFNMSPVAAELASAAAAEAKVLVRPVEAASLNTTSTQVHAMDLATMTADQQDFTTTFALTANSSSSSSTVTVAAVVLWFDVEFSERFCKDCPVTLSTSPSAEVTHWAHAVLPLQRSIQLAAAAAAAAGGSSGGSSGPPSSVQCRLSMARSRKQHRSLDISLEVGVGCDAPQARVYTMEVTGTD